MLRCFGHSSNCSFRTGIFDRLRCWATEPGRSSGLTGTRPLDQGIERSKRPDDQVRDHADERPSAAAGRTNEVQDVNTSGGGEGSADRSIGCPGSDEAPVRSFPPGVTHAVPLTRALRRAISYWRLALLGVVALLLFTALTGIAGSPLRVVVVAGESMLPTLDPGDAVLTLRRSSYEVGDVVAYRLPAGQPGAGRVVIHRIVRTTPEGFLLQGDNNEDLDPWTPGQAEVVGERALTVPRLGLLVGFLRTALGAGLIAAFVTFLVALDAGERKRSGRTATAPQGTSFSRTSRR